MSTPTTELKDLFSEVLDLPPNCLKFSQVCPEHFVIGTYFLEEDPDAQPEESEIEEKLGGLDINSNGNGPESSDKETNQDGNSEQEDGEQSKENAKIHAQKRSGMLILCKLAAKADSNGGPGVEVIILQKLAQPSAIYDLQFRNDVLITTSTTGTLSLFELVPPGKRGHGKFMVDDTVLPIKKAGWEKQWEARSAFFQDALFADIPSMDSDTDEPEKDEVDRDAAYLQHIRTKQLCDKSTLIISLDWHPVVQNMFAVSLSNGSIVVVKHNYRTIEYLNDSALLPLSGGGNLQKHTDNAWCLVWGEWYLAKRQGYLQDVVITNLYSGGDDCKIRFMRLRLNATGGSPQGYSRDIQVSDAGVTSLEMVGSCSASVSKNGRSRHIDFLLVGSYDNKVRVVGICEWYELEEGDEPAIQVFTTLDLGGTVHKLSLIGTNQITEMKIPSRMAVLASCAHVGVRLLHLTFNPEGFKWTIEVVAKYEGHNSLNYASDIVLKENLRDPELKKVMEKEDMSICVSTSFYDRLMCVWGFKKYWGGSVAVGEGSSGIEA